MSNDFNSKCSLGFKILDNLQLYFHLINGSWHFGLCVKWTSIMPYRPVPNSRQPEITTKCVPTLPDDRFNNSKQSSWHVHACLFRQWIRIENT